MVHISGSISGPHLKPLKNVVSEGFCKQSFQEGVLLSGDLVQKQAFQKGDGSHLLFQFFCCGGWWMLVLDYKGGWRRSCETRFICHPLLERRKRVKRRERPEVKTPPFLHIFGGPSKRTGSSSTLLGRKDSCFLNLPKPRFLRYLQEMLVVTI